MPPFRFSIGSARTRNTQPLSIGAPQIHSAGGDPPLQPQIDDLIARIEALEAVDVSPAHFILQGGVIEVTDEGTEERAEPAIGVEKVLVGV